MSRGVLTMLVECSAFLVIAKKNLEVQVFVHRIYLIVSNIINLICSQKRLLCARYRTDF
jgi:hypothetical protein